MMATTSRGRGCSSAGGGAPPATTALPSASTEKTALTTEGGELPEMIQGKRKVESDLSSASAGGGDGGVEAKRPRLRTISSVHDLLEATHEATHLDAKGLTAAAEGEGVPDTPDPDESVSGRVGPDGLWRRLVSVDGFQTEVYGIHHTNKTGRAALRVVVIPGNPGQAAYYLPLLRYLHQELDGSVDVMAISHKGHGINCSCEQAFSLSDQIQHKAEFIRQYCFKDDGGTPVALVGHSIGVYMALHVARLLEEDGNEKKSRREGPGGVGEGSAEDSAGKEDKQGERIAKVVGMFPFLSVNSRGSTRQSFLRTVCQAPQVLAAAGSLLGILPHGLRRNVIQLCGGGNLQEHALDSTGMLMRYWNCYNAFHLAKTEFADLSAPPDWDLLRRLGDRACMITCPRDMWAPDWMMAEMVQALPSLHIIHDRSMVHAFCVDDAMSKSMAVHLSDVLSRHVTPTPASNDQQVAASIGVGPDTDNKTQDES